LDISSREEGTRFATEVVAGETGLVCAGEGVVDMQQQHARSEREMRLECKVHEIKPAASRTGRGRRRRRRRRRRRKRRW
jgi:hypothetical protein